MQNKHRATKATEAKISAVSLGNSRSNPVRNKAAASGMPKSTAKNRAHVGILLELPIFMTPDAA
jgi:hypothetical protein